MIRKYEHYDINWSGLNNLITDPDLKNELRTLTNTDQRLALRTLKNIELEIKIKKLIQYYQNGSDSNGKQLRKYEQLKQVRTLTKTDHKKFNESYSIKYQKQLLCLTLGAESN